MGWEYGGTAARARGETCPALDSMVGPLRDLQGLELVLRS